MMIATCSISSLRRMFELWTLAAFASRAASMEAVSDRGWSWTRCQWWARSAAGAWFADAGSSSIASASRRCSRPTAPGSGVP